MPLKCSSSRARWPASVITPAFADELFADYSRDFQNADRRVRRVLNRIREGVGLKRPNTAQRSPAAAFLTTSFRIFNWVVSDPQANARRPQSSGTLSSGAYREPRFESTVVAR